MLPTHSPAETIAIAPENLEIANTYLQTQDIAQTANDLGIPVEFVADVLNKKDVRTYINTVFFDVGFNNRYKMRAAMDAIIKQKFKEMQESETGSSKDIADLLALSHKMTMDALALELKVEEAKNSHLRTQTNIQINADGGSKYNSLIERLLEANK